MIAGYVYDFVGLEKGMTSANAPVTVVRDLGLTLGLSRAWWSFRATT